jgi:hypothetical protein
VEDLPHTPRAKARGKESPNQRVLMCSLACHMSLLDATPGRRKVKIFVSPSIWDDVMGKLTKDVVPRVCMFVVCSWES